MTRLTISEKDPRWSFLSATLFVAGISVMVVFSTVTFAFAQTSSINGASQTQVDAALQDLSEIYGSPVVRVDQAKAICNDEQYFLACAEIGKNNNLFDEARAEQVDALVTELKGDVVNQITQCTNVECLVGVAIESAAGA